MASLRTLYLTAPLVLIAIASPARSEGPDVATPPRDQAVDEIVVKGQQPSTPDLFVVSPARATPNEPDSAELIKLVPGGGLVDNGPLSGEIQYRGLFGNRIRSTVDDMYISPGGPNAMDPPMHYAPRALVESLTVDRGIAPVSRGPEAFGGAVRAQLKTSQFSDDSGWKFGGDLMLGGRSVDASVNGGGILRAANEHHRIHFLGSADYGNDYEAPSGEVRPTEFERYTYGAGYGFRLGEHELGLDYRHNDTQQTGNPALPADIQFFNTEIVNTDYSGQLGKVTIDARVFFSDIDHQMDNFSLRTATPPANRRTVDAEADTIGYELGGALPLFSGELSFGLDGQLSDHAALVTNPSNAAFFAIAFNDVNRDLYGIFGEWSGSLAEKWDLEVGLRYSRTQMRAGEVDASPAPSAPLRDAFNDANRHKGDNLVDFVAIGGFEPGEDWRLELGFGRKTRSPSYYERYLWIPLEVTGGLADGNNYLGDIDLEPEKVYEVEGGFEWRRSGIYIAPRAFYRWVDDYIQGTPTANPNVLKYTNVEAQLYGVDLPYGVRLPFDFQLDGILSYVRGKRMDIVDDLYRIAPLQGRTTFSYMRDTWVVAIEGVYAASQNNVSVTNGESPSRRWGAMNLYAQWEPIAQLGLEFGIDNVTDNEYADHLSGIARFTSPGVTAGDPIPAPGRSYYGRITGRF